MCLFSSVSPFSLCLCLRLVCGGLCVRARTFCCFTLLFYAGSNAQHRLPLTHSPTLTLTSSYILCHIIIHTMSHHHTYYVTSSGTERRKIVSLSHTHPLSPSLTVSHPPSLPPSLSLSLTHTHTLSFSLSLALTLSHSLSLTHTHAQTHPGILRGAERSKAQADGRCARQPRL